MGSDESKEEVKATYTQCMRNLAAEGKCQYVCAPCSVSGPSYAQMKTHVHTKHAALNLDMSFDVECKACRESFNGVPSFHKHYHTQHCTLEPCMSSRTCGKGSQAEPMSVKILSAVEIKPDNDGESFETVSIYCWATYAAFDSGFISTEIEDEMLAKFLGISEDNNEKETRECKQTLSSQTQ